MKTTKNKESTVLEEKVLKSSLDTHEAVPVFGKGLGFKNRNFLVNITAVCNNLVQNTQDCFFKIGKRGIKSPFSEK